MDCFTDAYPVLAAWVRDGWVEIGYNDFSRSLVRVLDQGGLVWEGGEACSSVDEALRLAEDAIEAWLDEHG
ncbi:MAG: hypothetical protein AAF624_16990 [Bacteroidota bacterium]